MSLDSITPSSVALLLTKLEIPTITARVLRRSRLTDLFHRSGGRKVTILTAPAGYGKTTLLGEWYALNSSPGNRFAWITLDQFDNAPFRFWSYLIAAIKRPYPTIKFEAKDLIFRGYDPQDFTRLIPLLNQISTLPGVLNLILDDYHTITDPRINDSIGYIIDHQPENLHLVISSRNRPDLPTARLRTLGRLQDINTQSMAFSFEETKKYLAEMIKNDLSSQQIIEIYENTEGWIAGLQMTAISHEVMHDFRSNRNRFLIEKSSFPDYFSEEVLKKQPPVIQEFLLKTSLLNEFTPELCNYLLGRDDSRKIIDELIAQNLFIVPIDNNHQWYRYHPLFASSLVERMQKADSEVIQTLHSKALEWFLSKKYPDRAVVHALLSGQEDRAVEIIDTIAMRAIINFDVIKLIHWINAIPDHLLLLRPRLGIYNAVAYFLLGQYDLAQVNLAKVENIIKTADGVDTADQEKQALLWEIDAVRAAMEAIAANHIEGLAAGNHLLADTKKEGDFIYAMLTHAMGMACEILGKLGEAANVFATARQYGLTYNYYYGYFHSCVALADVLLKQGRVNESREEYNRALDFAIELNLEHATVSLAQASLMEIAIEQNNLPLADKLAKGILTNFDKTIISESVWISHIDRCAYLTNYFVRKNDLSKARDYLGRALNSYQDFLTAGAPMPICLMEACFRIARAESRSNDASDWSKVSNELLTPENLKTPAGRLFQARLDMVQGRQDQAIILLANLVDDYRKTEYEGQLLKSLIVYALCLHSSGKVQDAVAAIGKAVEIGAARGYARVFLEEGEDLRDLLCIFQGTSDAKAISTEHPGYTEFLLKLLNAECVQQDSSNAQSEPEMTTLHLLQEPLSHRETEVTRMLVYGKSTKEIAEALMISTNTAKTHIKNVYRKFGVHSHNSLLNRIKELGD